MKDDIIEKYFSEMLIPKLESFSIPDEEINAVVSSIREQILSCIFHWNDLAFRQTILFIGEEEGAYYLPKVSRAVRAFVAATLRNSALEVIHCEYNQDNRLRSRRVSDTAIREITAAALKYFRDVDFENISNSIVSLENDKYGELAKKYPMAWTAFTQLANSANNTIVYNPVSPSKVSAIGISYKQPVLAKKQLPSSKGLFSRVVVEDGYSPVINSELNRVLEMAIAQKIPLIIDSLKALSRNINVVLYVAEYLLSNDQVRT